MGQHLDVPGCRRNSREELSPQPLSQHGAEFKSDLAQRQKNPHARGMDKQMLGSYFCDFYEDKQYLEDFRRS